MAIQEETTSSVTFVYMEEREPSLTHDIGVAATRFQRAMSQVVGAVVRPFDLTAPEYGILDHVRSNPGVSNADLARYLLVSPQALGRMSADLQRRGFIRRVPGQRGRRSPIEVTEEGLNLAKRVTPIVDDALQGLLATLDPTEKSMLLRTLNTAVDSVAPRQRADPTARR